jgi:hypothetical protein
MVDTDRGAAALWDARYLVKDAHDQLHRALRLHSRPLIGRIGHARRMLEIAMVIEEIGRRLAGISHTEMAIEPAVRDVIDAGPGRAAVHTALERAVDAIGTLSERIDSALAELGADSLSTPNPAWFAPESEDSQPESRRGRPLRTEYQPVYTAG